MKLRKAISYRMIDIKKSIILFYGIMALSFILVILLNTFTTETSGVHVNGMEFCTFIFLFVWGLNSFRQPFMVLLQNGISRKTMFTSYMIIMTIVAGGMAFFESIIYFVFHANNLYLSAFMQIYDGISLNVFSEILLTFVWSFSLYLAAAMFGYFVTTLYYLMNLTAKLIVSIGIPALILVILPILDEYVCAGAIFQFIGKAISYVVGTYGDSYHPFNCILSGLLVALVFAGISYVMVKKVVVKRK